MSTDPTPASPRLERLRAIAFNGDFIEAFAHLSDLDIMRLCAWRLLERENFAAAGNLARHRAPYFHARLSPLPARTHARAPAEQTPDAPIGTSPHAPPSPPRGEDPPSYVELVRRQAEAGVESLYRREAERLGDDGTLAEAAAEPGPEAKRIETLLRGLPRDFVAAAETCEPGEPHPRDYRHPSWDPDLGAEIDLVMRDLLSLRFTGDPAAVTAEHLRADAARERAKQREERDDAEAAAGGPDTPPPTDPAP